MEFSVGGRVYHNRLGKGTIDHFGGEVVEVVFDGQKFKERALSVLPADLVKLTEEKLVLEGVFRRYPTSDDGDDVDLYVGDHALKTVLESLAGKKLRVTVEEIEDEA